MNNSILLRFPTSRVSIPGVNTGHGPNMAATTGLVTADKTIYCSL